MTAPATGGYAPGSKEEFEFLLGLVRNIQEFPRMSRSEQDELLSRLEAYECLAQVVKLLTWRVSHGNSGRADIFNDYLWLLRVQYLGFEDFDSFLDTAVSCVETTGIPFSLLRIHVAEDILGSDNYRSHSRLYEVLVNSFAELSQQVLLLERLALIYEKKLFLQTDVEAAYRRLLEVDPVNVKALRYFRVLHVQFGQWDEAVHYLRRLVGAAANSYERIRAAHELAQVYLYNMNNPVQSRDTILEFNLDAYPEARQTLIESLERLGDFDELLRVLAQVDLVTRDEKERSAIKLKICMLKLRKGQKHEALAYARDSVALAPSNLLTHEALLSALVEVDDVIGVTRALETLIPNVKVQSSREVLSKLLSRAQGLVEGFASPQSGNAANTVTGK